MSENASRDQNSVPVTLFQIDGEARGNLMMGRIDSLTGRILVDSLSGSGSVTSVSVVTANGFAGSVANPTTTPAITLSTTVSGVLKGNGTAISAASAGTDYVAPGAITTDGITMSTARLLGRTTASTGAVEEITVGTGLSLSAGSLTATGGTGDVVGPASATDNAITRFDGTTGKLVQNSTVTVSDAGVVSGAGLLLSGLTASEIVITDASKNLVSAAVATYPSLTELTYVKGVTSAIQTQLNAKQATITFGTGVQTALGVNIGSAGAPVLFNGALGTPSSGTVTNLTGTASININGTVGATTPTTGVFTTLVAGSTTSLLLGTAGSAVGNIGFRNATSGTITLEPVTGALGTVTLSLPAATDTLVGKATTDTLTNKTIQAGILDYVIEPASDDTYEGESTNDLNAGDTTAQWDLLYLDATSGRWEFADADAAATAGGVLLALGAAAGTDGNPLNVVFRGVIRNDGWTWSGVGKPLYVSTTAGAMTETAPSGTDDVIRVVGYTLSDDCIYFNPSNDWITHT